MLHYATIFFVITVLAFVLGFLAHILVGSAVLIAKICFFVFLALFLTCLITDLIKRRKSRKALVKK